MDSREEFRHLLPARTVDRHRCRPVGRTIDLYLNGERKQQSRTSNLIFSARLVEFISAIMTLFPGDVIATGTPSGIGPMKLGDKVEVRIDGVGSLINRVQ